MSSPENGPSFAIAETSEQSGYIRRMLDKTLRIVGKAGLAASLTLGSGAVSVAHEVVTAEDNQAFASDTGGYPWHDAQKIARPPAGDDITWGYRDKVACDNKSPEYDCSTAKVGEWFYRDQWGYDLRNCTSYVAWKIKEEFGVNVSGWGNADAWDDRARNAGYAVNQGDPEPGDIAVWDNMHVAFVERVNPDGTVNVSEYNSGLSGNFGRRSNIRANHYIDVNGEGKPWTGAAGAGTGGTAGGPEAAGSGASIGVAAEGEELTDGNWVYTNVGGSAWLIKPRDQWTANDTHYWGNEPEWVSTEQIHAREAGFGGADKNPPRDGTTVFVDGGNGQQYYFFRGRAYPIGTDELDDLQVRDQARPIPATGNRLGGFVGGLARLAHGEVYRRAGRPEVRQYIVNANGVVGLHVNNETVLECLRVTQGRRPFIIPQAAALAGTETSDGAGCAFPPGMVLRGPGGAEQWRMEGDNSRSRPYVRRYYPDALRTYLHTGGNPQHHVLERTGAINNVPEGPHMDLPNGIFFLNLGNGDQFKIENGIFRKIPWPDMNACLGNTNPIPVPGNAVGPIPQGPPMTCALNNKVLAHNGVTYWVEGGRSHRIPNLNVQNCTTVRRGTGAPVSVDEGALSLYKPSTPAYCPYEYERGLYFVIERGDNRVWFIEPNGIKRHAGSLCVTDPATTEWKQFRVWQVPPGETAGHTEGPNWWANGAVCDRLAKVKV